MNADTAYEYVTGIVSHLRWGSREVVHELLA